MVIVLIILGPFELVLHYPIIDSSHWLKEEIHLIIDKFFREKSLVLMASTLSSCTFLLIFWFLPVVVFVTIFKQLIEMIF